MNNFEVGDLVMIINPRFNSIWEKIEKNIGRESVGMVIKKHEEYFEVEFDCDCVMIEKISFDLKATDLQIIVKSSNANSVKVIMSI